MINKIIKMINKIIKMIIKVVHPQNRFKWLTKTFKEKSKHGTAFNKFVFMVYLVSHSIFNLKKLLLTI